MASLSSGPVKARAGAPGGIGRPEKCLKRSVMTGLNSSRQHLVTAAVLVIGDEILSGRTKDKNIGYIAEYLTNLGIDLKEVRVVPDEEDEIIPALNALRSR